MRIFLGIVGLALSAQAVAAPSRDEIRAWITTYADATTLDEPMGRLNAAELDRLAPYIPPGLYAEFAFPELELEVEATARYAPHEIYRVETAARAGQARVGAHGELENYTVGQPFSREQIEQAEPRAAGYMVAWNHIHRWQHRGYMTENLVMHYVDRAQGTGGTLVEGFSGGGHISRYVGQAYYRVYLSHIAGLSESAYQVADAAAERLLWKDFIDIFEPRDLKGTRFVVERALDPNEEDQVNSYLPSERRIRRLSARERADAFLGSNYSLDDFEGFSGRVADFDWTYLGRKAVLQVADTREPLAYFHGPASRIANDRWQVRPCYVVELTPKWAAHPMASKIMFVDEDTWNVDLALLFSRDNALWKSIQTIYHRSDDDRPDAPPGATVSRWTATSAVNYQVDDATVTRAIVPVDFPEFDADEMRRKFSVSSLTEGR
jgi:hypothetical protein